ncbi:MAG: DUF4956 domain-containing protein [Clostridium sp.]|nr:DUF4956 domain-containing protein [Clostridium sp.]
MSFADIFRQSFLEGYSGGEIGTTRTVIALAVTCILGFYIFFIYRIITRKIFYSKTFNISLVALAIITAAVILTIQSSIVVSLGMVGALSIVRFRTAIKEPMDLIFLFWAISVGIICGAGLFETGILASLLLTAVIFVLDRIPVAKAPMIFVVNADSSSGQGKAILDIVRKYSKYYKVKSRNVSNGKLDMVVEVRISEEEEFVNEVSAMEHVHSVSLISHDGEATF